MTGPRRAREYGYPLVLTVLATASALVVVLVLGAASQVRAARVVVAEQQAKLDAHAALAHLAAAQSKEAGNVELAGTEILAETGATCTLGDPGCVRVAALRRVPGAVELGVVVTADCDGCTTYPVRLRVWVRDGTATTLSDLSLR